MSYKWFYAIVFTLLSLTELVLSQTIDLCARNMRIDSITFITGRNQWFFTSNGMYWLLKDEFMRNFNETTVKQGIKIPEPFKRGDAAVFKDSLKACKDSKTAGKAKKEQEVIVVEKTENGNMIMILDLRDSSWKAAHPYNEDRSIGQAQVDWTQPIDAMFVYGETQIFVLQKNRYASIDYKNLCQDPDDFSKPFDGQKSYDFETKDTIDAFTMVDDNRFYMFQGINFFEGKIMSEDKGKVTTNKEIGYNIVDRFFNYKAECPGYSRPPSIPTEASTPPQPGPETQPPGEGPAPTADEGTGNEVTTGGGEESGSLLWIILVIIVIIIIIIIIFLIVALSARKKSDIGQESAVSLGRSASAVGKDIDGRGSPSTSSLRSTAGGAGGKASTFAGSSPSTMSIRSNISPAPKPKSGSTSADKKSSPGKSSMSKKSPA